MPIDIDNISPSEYAGAMLFRHAEATVTYEEGGVTFVPATLNMNRFQNVILEVNDGSDVALSWYEGEDLILAYDLADGAELAPDEEVSLRVTGIGR